MLDFEASGALLQASLVMRDRQTDSWWSIMTAAAIGGEMEGSRLRQLAVGEKTTWGDWKKRHPRTLALSVEGREHEASDPYAPYFASPDTFRGLAIDDARLPPKAPVYAFRVDGRPWAVAHRVIEGGRLHEIDDGSGRRLFFFRPRGASLFASTEAWLLGAGTGLAELAPEEIHARLAANPAGAKPLGGLDTFWYSWVAVHAGTALLE